MTAQPGTQSLKSYRAAIRAAWLPLVGRERLSSHEYELVKAWFEQPVPLRVVLQSIHQISVRAKSGGIVIYSLGVIRADLIEVWRRHALANVGAETETRHWREKWAEDMESFAGEQTNPEIAARLRELGRDLKKLTLEETQTRFQEICRDLDAWLCPTTPGSESEV